MEFLDITEVKECFRAGDDAKLLDAFQRFIASDKWPTSCHKWGEENSEEFSAFIQHIVPLLPVSTPVDVVGELCRNYMLGLAQVPQSIDIAAKVFVDFWNRKRAEEDNDVVSFLSVYADPSRRGLRCRNRTQCGGACRPAGH